MVPPRARRPPTSGGSWRPPRTWRSRRPSDCRPSIPASAAGPTSPRTRRVAGLRRHAPWAAEDLPRLVELERDGIEAARGNSLVHGDLYPHNILLTAQRVVFVDWPHARLGAPVIDLVTFLSSVAAAGVDPEPYVPTDGAVTEVLAAHAGFLLAGGLAAGATPIIEAKLHLGRGALAWLETRL
ncbi:phosphotransferase family protein [Dactylosporangium cerinum]